MTLEYTRRWWREPLLHFVVLGLAVFALHRMFGSVSAAPSELERVISITAQRQRELVDHFAKQRGRQPTGAELQTLVEEWSTGEMLYRESKRLGLDREDETIRQHLMQKMRFVLESRGVVPEPTNDVLQQWLEQHPQRFARPASTDFAHIPLAGDQPESQARAEALRQALAQGSGPQVGEPERLYHYRQRTREHIQSLFGVTFAEALEKQPLGHWALQPSDTGWHVIRVEARRESGLPALAQSRDEVLRHWRAHQQRQLALQAMASLRQAYRVQVDAP